MTQTKARLLVITQDIDIKRLMENFMRHERFQAAITSSVAHAAQFIRSNPLPDVIVLDISSSDTHWAEFLQQLRARVEYARLPVLVLTEIPDPDLVRAALQAGASRYLTKLFVAKNLLSTIEEMLTEPQAPPKNSRPLTARLGGSS